MLTSPITGMSYIPQLLTHQVHPGAPGVLVKTIPRRKLSNQISLRWTTPGRLQTAHTILKFRNTRIFYKININYPHIAKKLFLLRKKKKTFPNICSLIRSLLQASYTFPHHLNRNKYIYKIKYVRFGGMKSCKILATNVSLTPSESSVCRNIGCRFEKQMAHSPYANIKRQRRAQ